MDVSRLAAKQKKIKEYEETLGSPFDNGELRKKFGHLIESYRTLLFRAWKSPDTASAEDLASMERELEELHEEVRLCARRR